MPRLAWDNAAHMLLERTLDDSANRRTLLPEAFLIADELLRTASRIVDGLVVNMDALRRNLAVYGPFAASERVLMALVKSGADRQAMHEKLPRREEVMPVGPATRANRLVRLLPRLDPTAWQIALGLPLSKMLVDDLGYSCLAHEISGCRCRVVSLGPPLALGVGPDVLGGVRLASTAVIDMNPSIPTA